VLLIGVHQAGGCLIGDGRGEPSVQVGHPDRVTRGMVMAGAAVAAEGLGKRFGPVPALGGVDLELPAGGVPGLLGPNGAGKTTTVRILATLLKPGRGRARVAGFDATEHPQAVRRLIGLSGQYAAVDPFLTGEEHLAMIGRLYGLFRRAARQRIAEPVEQLDLTGAAGRLVRTYSGDAPSAGCRRQPAGRAPGPVPR
jgi:ABC-2 type transport system ATP-binding protein